MVQVLCYKSSNVHRFSYLTTAYFRSNFKWMKSLIIFIPLPSSYLLCLTCIKTGVCINLLFNLAQSRDPVTHRLPAVVGAPFSPLQQSLADTEESDLWDHVTGPEQNTSIKKKKIQVCKYTDFSFFSMQGRQDKRSFNFLKCFIALFILFQFLVFLEQAIQ